jgi:sulfur carrier protein ThiS
MDGITMTIKIIVRNKIFEIQEEKKLKFALLELDLMPESYLAVRNGEMINGEDMVKHGDEIKLIAVISGG